MEYLHFSGIIMSLALAFIILKKNRDLSDVILGIWLIFLGLDFLAEYFLFVKGKIVLLGFTYSMPAFSAAMLFIYVSTLSAEKRKFMPTSLFHFIPFVLVNVVMLIYIFSMPLVEREVFLEQTTFNTRPLFFHIFQFIMLIIVPVYLIWIYNLLKKHIKNIKQKFSCEDNINLFWVNFLLLSIAIFWLVLFATKLINGYYNTLQFNEFTLSISIFEIFLIIIIGYFGLKQGVIFISLPVQNPTEENTDKKYKSTGLSSEDAKDFLPNLLNYMKTEKPYLDGELSLIKLADLMNIPTHHLSQIINEQLKMNFFEFVNEYRVEEVKQKMMENQEGIYTILSLALDSGFNSKSSFNSVFKKMTHQTPKEYMHSL